MIPYAILVLTGMIVRNFYDKESLKNAIQDYERSGIPIHVYKWDDQVKFYVQLEVKTF